MTLVVWAPGGTSGILVRSPASAGETLPKGGRDELCREEAAQEDAQAQAPQDAEEDALAAQAQVAQRAALVRYLEEASHIEASSRCGRCGVQMREA